jgi:hypothetical protein
MPSKRIFRLAYHASQSRNLRFRIHQLRDADAFAELSAVLYRRGYEYGGLFLNLPTDELKKGHQAPKEALPVDVSSLTSMDLLVLNTRPPMHDLSEEDKKRVPPGDNTLEDKVFQALKQYFDICARSRILLSKGIAERLPAKYENRAHIKFRQSHDGSYLKHRAYTDRLWQRPPRQMSTAFYLIQIPALWEDGPGLLNAFGMAGTETLVWNYILRTRFPHWVGRYEFLMAEVVPSKLPRQPTNLTFADDWKVTPILRIPLQTSDTQKPSVRSSSRQDRTK